MRPDKEMDRGKMISKKLSMIALAIIGLAAFALQTQAEMELELERLRCQALERGKAIQELQHETHQILEELDAMIADNTAEDKYSSISQILTLSEFMEYLYSSDIGLDQPSLEFRLNRELISRLSAINAPHPRKIESFSEFYARVRKNLDALHPPNKTL